MPGKHVKPQTRECVFQLLEYFEREKENGGSLLDVTCVQERVSQALGVSLKTISRIKQEGRPEAGTPATFKRRRRKSKTERLDDPIKMEVRDTLYNMYHEKKHVTLGTLSSELATKHILQISKSALRTLLLHLEFKYKKDDTRRALMERTNIATKRHFFLRKYLENKTADMSRNIIFLDETWIFSKGSAKRSWQDSSVKSVKKPEGYDGKRYIILHAGSKDGFVPNCSLVFASKSQTLDYHGAMNSAMFTKWIRDKLIPNLEEPSLVVLDNAPYHSVRSETQPSSAWKKQEIVEWLTLKEIQFEASMTKLEMLNIAKQHKVQDVFVIDEILRQNGHEVLRLPPYHCQFNAIELVWARAKNYYNEHAGRDGYGNAQVLQLWQEALDHCNPEFWANCVRHSEDLITRWYDREVFLAETPPVIINLNEDSSSEDDDD